MKMREIGKDMAISTRMTKEEWNDIKNRGDEFFNNRNVGYMNVVPTIIKFTNKSPFFKDLDDLDEQDKEKSGEEIQKEKLVKEEIKNKNGG